MQLKMVGWILLTALSTGLVSQSLASTATAATATSLVAGVACAVVKSDVESMFKVVVMFASPDQFSWRLTGLVLLSLFVIWAVYRLLSLWVSPGPNPVTLQTEPGTCSDNESSCSAQVTTTVAPQRSAASRGHSTHQSQRTSSVSLGGMRDVGIGMSPLLPPSSVPAVAQQGSSRLVIERVCCPRCNRRMHLFSKKDGVSDVLGWKCSAARTGASHCSVELLAETSTVAIIRAQPHQ